MKKISFAAMITIALATGTAFGGQCTGGDKNKLNPQPLPPGRHAQYHRKRGHKHRHGTNYQGGSCSSCKGPQVNTPTSTGNKPK